MRTFNPTLSGRFQSEQHISSTVIHSAAWRGGGGEMARMSADNVSSPNTGLTASARALKLREMTRTNCDWGYLSK